MSLLPSNVSTRLSIGRVHRQLPHAPDSSPLKMSSPIERFCEGIPARCPEQLLSQIGLRDPADCRKPPLSLDGAAARLRATDRAWRHVFCAPQFVQRLLLAVSLSQGAPRSAGDAGSMPQGILRRSL